MMKTRGWGRAALLLLLPVSAGCTGDAEPLEQPVPAAGTNPVEYPVSMWDRGLEGEAVLLLHVNELGDVDSAYVERTSGHAEFDTAAVRGARLLQFTPGRRGEHAVATWTRLPVRFARDSTATVGTTAAPGRTP
jgi:TonB family protein